jgi:hypothetical protein
LVRALSLDETTTNQLVRRCIPQDFLSELNDTPNADFQRFILIAGWFFDQIRLYIKFLKYVHHIDTTNFNQLSPEYYRLYASHYGLDLFTDDGIDFSKLVVKTEPGLYYREQALAEKDSKFYRFTLQQLQYEFKKFNKNFKVYRGYPLEIDFDVLNLCELRIEPTAHLSELYH